MAVRSAAQASASPSLCGAAAAAAAAAPAAPPAACATTCPPPGCTCRCTAAAPCPRSPCCGGSRPGRRHEPSWPQSPAPPTEGGSDVNVLQAAGGVSAGGVRIHSTPCRSSNCRRPPGEQPTGFCCRVVMLGPTPPCGHTPRCMRHRAAPRRDKGTARVVLCTCASAVNQPHLQAFGDVMIHRQPVVHDVLGGGLVHPAAVAEHCTAWWRGGGGGGGGGGTVGSVAGRRGGRQAGCAGEWRARWSDQRAQGAGGQPTTAEAPRALGARRCAASARRPPSNTVPRSRSLSDLRGSRPHSTRCGAPPAAPPTRC